MKTHHSSSSCLTISIALSLLIGCSWSTEQSQSLRLATTTSTRDSGLLDVLVPMFEKKAATKVKVIAVGSGQALELGRLGDADVLLTHSPDAEKAFVAEGHGKERRSVMFNDFILVGPDADPAGIKEKKTIGEAFTQIADSKSPFVSRGDESGTHRKEQTIWKETKIDPVGEWYVQAGTGMADVLRMADEKKAYTLSDRATYLAQRGKLDLEIVLEGDAMLKNPYSVIIVNSEKHPKVNHADAEKFVEFLMSPEIQRVIGDFGVEQFGQALFFPDAEGVAQK